MYDLEQTLRLYDLMLSEDDLSPDQAKTLLSTHVPRDEVVMLESREGEIVGVVCFLQLADVYEALLEENPEQSPEGKYVFVTYAHVEGYSGASWLIGEEPSAVVRELLSCLLRRCPGASRIAFKNTDGQLTVEKVKTYGKVQGEARHESDRCGDSGPTESSNLGDKVHRRGRPPEPSPGGSEEQEGAKAS